MALSESLKMTIKAAETAAENSWHGGGESAGGENG